MYWPRVSECVDSCVRICPLNRWNVLVVRFGMCWSLCSRLFFESSACICLVFRNALVAVVRFVILIVGMYWSRVSEYVGSCARVCFLNCRNVLVTCFKMCWSLCSGLFFESSECIGSVFRNVLVVVVGFVF